MKTIVLIPSLFASILILVACGGGTSENDTKGDAAEDDSPALNESVKPAFNSEGAEAGLQGCLNRGLYVNGPHTVSTSESISRILQNGDLQSEAKTYIERYEVLKLSDSGVSEVDVTTTFTSTEGAASGNFVSPYELDGYQLRIVGQSRDMPNPNARIHFFDLEQGQSVPQAINVGSDAAPIIFTYVDTYVGREEVFIANRAMKACRVDTLITQDTDQPEFRRRATISRWYGLGTGLKLLEESVSFPDSVLDISSEARKLTAATINNEKIF